MPNRNPKRGLVAFIDLLGFSARVRAIQDPAELGALDRSIRRVQRAFEHKTTDPILREKQKIFQKKVLAFSDCIVVAMSEKSDFAEMQGHFDTEMSELSEFASAQGLCVLNNIFVRGGVDFGWYYH